MTKQLDSNIPQYVVSFVWKTRGRTVISDCPQGTKSLPWNMVLVRAVFIQVPKETRRAEVLLTGIYRQVHGRSHEENARHIQCIMYEQYGNTALLRSRARPVLSIMGRS